MRCPTCHQPIPEPTPPSNPGDLVPTVVELVGKGASTAHGVATSIAGGRAPTRSEVESVRRLLTRAVREGRLERTERRLGGTGGTPAVEYRRP